jgi:8-oxo-dGTP pyrophosphatase MutT (NUDIX family)
MEPQKAPPTPKPSSTVMVVRPLAEEVEGGGFAARTATSGGFEIFMVRRHSKSRFMPDRYVFPGGRLEEYDASQPALALLYGFDQAGKQPVFRDASGRGAWAAELPLTRSQQAGLYIAAFRELFEESGVLLAIEKATGQPLDLQTDQGLADRFAQYRLEMQADRLNFVGMLERENLLLDYNALIYFSHWITPLSEPYRFDARFFLAGAPLNQAAESDHFETSDGLWLTPQTALDRYAAGDFNIAYPTLLHLEWLAGQPTLEGALEAARRKPVVAAMPDQLPDDENGPVFLLPPDVINNW